MDFLVVFLIAWTAMLILGMYVGSEKGRGAGEGFLLAFLFGPFGILIEALLPSKTLTRTPGNGQSSPVPSPRPAADPEAEKEALRRHAARIEAERIAEEAETRRSKAERDRERMAKRQWYLDRGITPGPLAWLELFSVYFVSWYKNAGDLAQVAVWAACVSIPAAVIAILVFRR